jgi:hypothetical protein
MDESSNTQSMRGTCGILSLWWTPHHVIHSEINQSKKMESRKTDDVLNIKIKINLKSVSLKNCMEMIFSFG